MFRGNVVSLYVASNAAVPMESTQEVKAVAGQGLEGDRYFDGTGHLVQNSWRGARNNAD